jgi:hypothetical protein
MTGTDCWFIWLCIVRWLRFAALCGLLDGSGTGFVFFTSFFGTGIFGVGFTTTATFCFLVILWQK